MLIAVAARARLAFRTETPLAYLVFPALGWAGLRFGRRGATLAITVAAGFAVWNTTDYHGPSSTTRLDERAQPTLIAVAALSTLCLAALVSERGQFAERLDAHARALVKASDTERARLEHNLHDGAQQRLTALTIRLGLAAESARGARRAGRARRSTPPQGGAPRDRRAARTVAGHPPARPDRRRSRGGVRRVAPRSRSRSPGSSCPRRGFHTDRRSDRLLHPRGGA